MRSYAIYHVALEVAFALACAGAGALLIWRRPDEWIALLVSLSFVAAAVATPPTITALVVARPQWHALGDIVLAAYIGTNVVIYLFPDGRFVPRWTRWAAIVIVGWAGAWVVFPAVRMTTWPLLPGLLATLTVIGTFAFSQLYRFVRVSTPVQRQQTKWFVLGLSLGMAAVIVYDFNLLALVFGELNQPGRERILFHVVSRPLYYALRLLPVVGITIAILRYRLWHIDTLINRTLVYGTLSALLAGVYFGSVILLQGIVRSFQPAADSALVVVAATLGSAALFQPLRQRLQTSVDRRFYRHKYDAARTLEAFSLTLRNDVDLERLSEDLLELVQDTMQPAHVSLWLRDILPGSREHPFKER